MKDISVEYPMYYGATPDVFKKARELRRYETEAEKMLWTKLCRNQMLGLQFRRQHPINRFIVDFYCVKVKLVIEVDGKIHDIRENRVYDIGRSQILNDFEITVIRFTNEMIIGDLENVIKIIESTVKQLIVEIK
jgi:very-short-patch-repair endonuclease